MLSCNFLFLQLIADSFSIRAIFVVEVGNNALSYLILSNYVDMSQQRIDDIYYCRYDSARKS